MHSWDALFSRSGFVFWGGLAGGIAAAYIVIRRKGIPFSRIADVGAIGIAAGYAIGRTGCWAVGDDYGKPWPGGFLAVQFPEGAPASTVGIMQREFGVQFPAGTDPASIVAVYPTQLLEVALGLVMFFILWRLRDHKHAQGWLFGVYGVLAGAERFLVEFFRAKDDRFLYGGLSLAQLIALGAMLLGFIWMRLRRDPTPASPGIYAHPLATKRPVASSRLSASRR
jgi:phosphatidylglycerol---prolipoprotein diacylglyceryl transferase